jgi:integrase/recombinase XerD
MRPQRPAKGRARSTTVERRHRPVATLDFHGFRTARQGHDQLRGEAHHALLLLAVQTGLRISELTGLTRADLHLGSGAHVVCHGKGRKQRITPMTTNTVAVLRDWLNEHSGNHQTPLFPTRGGRQLSRDAIEHRITHYASIAAARCPSLRGKTITAHVLRHTTAMRLLHAGIDTSIIALWLGHVSVDTTQIYLHADLEIKQRALARTRPPNSHAGRYQPPDQLLTWLEALRLCRPNQHQTPTPQGNPIQHRHNPEVGIMELMPTSA